MISMRTRYSKVTATYVSAVTEAVSELRTFAVVLNGLGVFEGSVLEYAQKAYQAILDLEEHKSIEEISIETSRHLSRRPFLDPDFSHQLSEMDVEHRFSFVYGRLQHAIHEALLVMPRYENGIDCEKLPYVSARAKDLEAHVHIRDGFEYFCVQALDLDWDDVISPQRSLPSPLAPRS